MSNYYSIDQIDQKNATYNLIIGERSNGKTYAVLEKAIKNYLKNGKQFGYVRRWKEDIIGRRAQSVFNPMGDCIKKLSDGEFSGVHYFAGKYYLCNYDDSGKAIYADNDLIGYTFALSDGEHDKSTSYPNINLIMFDEFITNRLYLVDEFVLFMNTVSTIVRRRSDVKVYMLGNTVNKFSPYFIEMGLTKVANMKQGSIDIYEYGDTDLKIAVEYCATTNKKNAKSNKYFAFDNPKLKMITSGSWELAIYPHLPTQYKPKNILAKFYIEFNDMTYQGDVVYVDNQTFIYIQDKKAPIDNKSQQLIYSLEPKGDINYNRNIYKPINRVQKKIAQYFATDKVFYQDNHVGDAISNYLKLCSS